MTQRDLVIVVAAAVEAAIWLMPILVAARRGADDRRRLSPGRFLLPYALLFATFLYVGRWFGSVGALVLLAVLLGALGAGRGTPTLYRWLYGRSWLEDNPGAVRRDAALWHVPVLVLAVASMTAALALAYLPGLAGGMP